MKKPDLRKELSERKYRPTNRILYWVYYFLMTKIVGRKYRAHYEIVDDISKCKGPCFVIFNHLSRIDHMYVTGACYPRRVNILAGYNEFFRSHLHTVFKLNNVLPKKQYVNDVGGTKAILSILRQGGCVALAPEGLATNDGTPKPIVPYTGGLFKKLGIPVYFLELRGQYLQNTKVCLDERYGETYAKLSLLFSPEDLASLSVEEIDGKINEAFRHDEYAWQKEKKIRWKMRGDACKNLDHLCYRCPRCGAEYQMEAEGDLIRCKACGNGARVDDYYAYHPLDESCVIPESPAAWAAQERVQIIREIREDPEYAFTARVKLGKLPNDHYVKNKATSEIVSEGDLTIDHEGLHYRGADTPAHDFDLDYHSLYTAITELDSGSFNLYIGGEFHDFLPQGDPVSLKFCMLIEEMHRLHVNFYRNFPWNDWMYRGTELEKSEAPAEE